MSETTRRMLVRGVAAAKAGDRSEARRYLERILYLDPSHDQQVDAHWWLFTICDDVAEKRDHLEEILVSDPTHADARRALAVLDGQLDPDEIVDADHLPEAAPDDESEPREARRFVCPQCGGRMQFDPGSQRLQCAYCGHRRTVFSAMQEGLAVEESDFVVTMATVKGHVVPQGVKTIKCQGCQAALISSDDLTARCPYCGSSHVVEDVAHAQILPEGLIPFAIEEHSANRRLADWLRRSLRGRPSRVARVRGLYLPIWTFDLMGEVKWRAEEQSQRGGGLSLSGGSSLSGSQDLGLFQGGRRIYEGIHSFLLDDIRVPASHLLPHELREAFATFEFDGVVPYDAAYLADQPAARYDVAVSDASLIARRQVLETARRKARIQAEVRMRNVHRFQVTPANLAVQSYKLLLVPFWLGNYRMDEKVYAVLVNGQTGEVVGEEPAGRIERLLGHWFGS